MSPLIKYMKQDKMISDHELVTQYTIHGEEFSENTIRSNDIQKQSNVFTKPIF